MSAKLPIGDVANEAVQFGLSHWLTVLRYAWFPSIVGGVLVSILLALSFDFSAIQGERLQLVDILAASRLPGYLLPVIGLVLALLFTFFSAGIFANIADFVVTGENRSGYFHLRTDGPVQRGFIAMVLSGAFGIGILGVASLISQTLSGQSFSTIISAVREISAWAATADPSQQPPQSIVSQYTVIGPFFGYLILFSVIPSIYLNIKLIPFVPGSVIENRLILFKAFSMTRGHLASILGTVFLLFVFLILIQIIYGLANAALELASGYFFNQNMALLGGLFSTVGFAAAIGLQAFFLAVQTAFQSIVYRRLETGQ